MMQRTLTLSDVLLVCICPMATLTAVEPQEKQNSGLHILELILNPIRNRAHHRAEWWRDLIPRFDSAGEKRE